MITKKQKQQIRDVFGRLKYNLSTVDWSNQGEKLLAITTQESKEHDRFRGSSIGRGMTVADEAKYFAVKRVFDYSQGEASPEVENYAMIQKSCYLAYSIAKNPRYKDAIDRWLKDHFDKAKEIASWDYSDLIEEVA